MLLLYRSEKDGDNIEIIPANKHTNGVEKNVLNICHSNLDIAKSYVYSVTFL